MITYPNSQFTLQSTASFNIPRLSNFRQVSSNGVASRKDNHDRRLLRRNRSRPNSALGRQPQDSIKSTVNGEGMRWMGEYFMPNAVHCWGQSRRALHLWLLHVLFVMSYRNNRFTAVHGPCRARLPLIHKAQSISLWSQDFFSNVPFTSLPDQVFVRQSNRDHPIAPPSSHRETLSDEITCHIRMKTLLMGISGRPRPLGPTKALHRGCTTTPSQARKCSGLPKQPSQAINLPRLLLAHRPKSHLEPACTAKPSRSKESESSFRSTTPYSI